MKRTLLALLVVGCGEASAPAPKVAAVVEVAAPAPPLSTAKVEPESALGSDWTGSYERRPANSTDEPDGVLTIEQPATDSFEFELNVHDDSGDHGQVRGLARVRGERLVFVGENECELYFTRLGAKTAIEVNDETACSVYHQARCSLAGTYEPRTKTQRRSASAAAVSTAAEVCVEYFAANRRCIEKAIAKMPDAAQQAQTRKTMADAERQWVDLLKDPSSAAAAAPGCKAGLAALRDTPACK